MTFARHGGKGKPPPANKRFPALAAAIFELEIGRTSASCVVSYNAIYLPHVAPGQSNGQPMLAVTLGEHTGGELVVEGTVHQIQYSPVVYDGWSELSWTRPFTGERFGLQFFTSARDRLADVAERVIAAQRPFRYRTASTDVNVICEVLGERSAYAGPPSGDYRWPDVDFSPRGCTVLDIGAHIGAFSRYCLREGANAVIACEPEPSNLELLQSNLAEALEAGIAEVRPVAVSSGPPGEALLVLGKERSDGVENTWRHALEGDSHYKDEELTRVPVPTVPLFGAGGALTDLVDFVKLDCEGAEIALLRGYEEGAWRNVRRIAFEWSFTKERDMATFAEACRLLEREGFTVCYEGKGSWERCLERWPWHMDALVFAFR